MKFLSLALLLISQIAAAAPPKAAITTFAEMDSCALIANARQESFEMIEGIETALQQKDSHHLANTLNWAQTERVPRLLTMRAILSARGLGTLDSHPLHPQEFEILARIQTLTSNVSDYAGQRGFGDLLESDRMVLAILGAPVCH
jgi:hypothetical protein